MSDRVPDYTQPIKGWKLWRILGNGKLEWRSLHDTIKWKLHQSVQAQCRSNLDHLIPHDFFPVPYLSCTCGIYAWKSYELAVDNVRDWILSPNLDHLCHLVIGPVLLWGRIIQHENGYRAEWAKITESPQHIMKEECDEHWQTAERNLRRALGVPRTITKCFLTRYIGSTQ